MSEYSLSVCVCVWVGRSEGGGVFNILSDSDLVGLAGLHSNGRRESSVSWEGGRRVCHLSNALSPTPLIDQFFFLFFFFSPRLLYS